MSVYLADTPDLFKKYSGRFRMLHIKDSNRFHIPSLHSIRAPIQPGPSWAKDTWTIARFLLLLQQPALSGYLLSWSALCAIRCAGGG